jgi:hypothetical protein
LNALAAEFGQYAAMLTQHTLMRVMDELKLHSERARNDLDLALRAASSTAAEAHFKLSALHLERLRNLNAPASPTTPNAS